jgi:WD40 repeat protein/serine/threonine protein kinase
MQAGETIDWSAVERGNPEHAAGLRAVRPALGAVAELSHSGERALAGVAVGADAPAGFVAGVLGDFRIHHEVGRGGMGVVYEAVQESLGRHVALKVLAAQNWKNTTHVERFKREARAVARLHHTNIVPVFGTGETDGVQYYAMQFIQGQSLDCVLHELKRLRRGQTARPGESTEDRSGSNGHRTALSASIAQGLVSGQFPDQGVTPVEGRPASAPPTGARTTPPFTSWGGDGRSDARGPATAADPTRSELTGRSEVQYFRGVARIGVQAAEALGYAHAQGILHRDVKPSNLLLDTQGTIWVTDFGLAKAEDSEELTSAGDIVGTVRYMAPERFKGNADPRSDVYALGLTLYEMLTLRPAFAYTDRARLIDRITHESPPAPRKLDPRIPRDLETVVLKAIAREPAARYPTATALAEDLGRYLADRPIRARRISWAGHTWRWCRRNPAVAGLLTTACALLVGLVVVLAASNARISGALELEKEARDQQKEARDKLEQALYYQWVGAAAEARDKNRSARAEELLERCPAHLRGWEWRYLKRLPFSSFPIPLNHSREDNIILQIAYSRDGKLLAAGSREGLVSVWDARTGNLVRQFQAQEKFVRGLAFTLDGRYLATGGEDDRVKLWDLRTDDKKPKCEFPIGETVALLALTISPDGKWLAASTQGQEIWVWDVNSGDKVIEPLKSPDRLAIQGLEFSSDGQQQLLSVSTEGVVMAWDVIARSSTVLFDAGLPGVNGAVFSADRQLIALGTEHGTVRVLRADPWRVACRDLEAHTGPINGLAFGSGGDRLAITRSDMTIQLWDIRTGQEALSAEFDGSKWLAITFSPNGDHLAAANAQEGEGTVRILDGTPLDRPVDGGEVRILEGHSRTVASLAYRANGERIVSASWDGTVKVWDAPWHREPRTLPAGGTPATGVAISPNGRRVAASSSDGTVRVWDADTGKELYPPLRARAGSVQGVAFSPDDMFLASAHNDGKVRVWDVDTGQLQKESPAHLHPVHGLTFSPKGEFVASAGGKGHTVKVWNWREDSVDDLKGPRIFVRNPTFSPDGRWVAAMTSDAVWLWDVRQIENKREFPIKASGRLHMAVFQPPDGRRLIVVSDDHVQLLDRDTGEVSTLVVPHAGDVLCAAISPDGKFLATGAGYRGRGEIRIWDVSRLERKP